VGGNEQEGQLYCYYPFKRHPQAMMLVTGKRAGSCITAHRSAGHSSSRTPWILLWQRRCDKQTKSCSTL